MSTSLHKAIPLKKKSKRSIFHNSIKHCWTSFKINIGQTLSFMATLWNLLFRWSINTIRIIKGHYCYYYYWKATNHARLKKKTSSRRPLYSWYKFLFFYTICEKNPLVKSYIDITTLLGLENLICSNFSNQTFSFVNHYSLLHWRRSNKPMHEKWGPLEANVLTRKASREGVRCIDWLFFLPLVLLTLLYQI